MIAFFIFIYLSPTFNERQSVFSELGRKCNQHLVAGQFSFQYIGSGDAISGDIFDMRHDAYHRDCDIFQTPVAEHSSLQGRHWNSSAFTRLHRWSRSTAGRSVVKPPRHSGFRYIYHYMIYTRFLECRREVLTAFPAHATR